MKDNTVGVFFALLRVGLWANASANLGVNANLGHNYKVDWEEVYQLAEEQSIIGVVLAGIERYINHSLDNNLSISRELLLQWIGEVQMLEQQNNSMNQFIEELIEKLRKADIYTLLLKGQGVAQCYEKPLWRANGDIDLFLSTDNYDKAKSFLQPLGDVTEPEEASKRHFAMQIGQWVVELHGTLHGGLSNNLDKVLDEVKKDVFYGGSVRSWLNNRTQVFIPSANCDAVYIFTHIIQHFYKGGIGLRQICDWCRLIWTFRSDLDILVLETRIRKAGLMSEWKAFAALAVEYLGMPSEAMPMYSSSLKWSKKASKIIEFVLETGNFGHNRDMSYFEKYPYLIRKVCSMGRRCSDLIRHARIFPLDSLRFFPNIMFNGLRSAVRGE